MSKVAECELFNINIHIYVHIYKDIYIDFVTYIHTHIYACEISEMLYRYEFSSYFDPTSSCDL